jgi:hypothetical protein
MATIRTDLPGPIGEKKLEKKPIKFSNLLLGAGLNLFEVTTLGQVSFHPTDDLAAMVI